MKWRSKSSCVARKVLNEKIHHSRLHEEKEAVKGVSEINRMISSCYSGCMYGCLYIFLSHTLFLSLTHSLSLSLSLFLSLAHSLFIQLPLLCSFICLYPYFSYVCLSFVFSFCPLSHGTNLLVDLL